MEYFMDKAAWLLWVPPIVLGLLLALEYWIPLRTSLQSKFHHVSTNLTIAGVNAILANFSFGGLYIAWTRHTSEQGWGLLNALGLGPIGNLLASLFLLDLFGYGIHWAHHRIPILWRFHRAHHSDLDIDATTALRFHVGEAVVTGCIRVISLPVLGVSWISLVVYEAMFQALGLYSHCNVRFSESIDYRIRFVLVSPRMHWLHHSRRPIDHNTNFGQIFSIWDRLLRTYRPPVTGEKFKLGLDEYPSPDHVALLPFYAIPLGHRCNSGFSS